MLQSCETLITKINEWQKAISKLERLADVFLKSSDEKPKAEIENKKREIVSLEKEYQELAYPELPNGENLFWPEKELLEEIAERTGWNKDKIKVRDNHLIKIILNNINLSQFSYDFSLFHNLEKFDARFCQFKKFPRFFTSVNDIWIDDNPGIDIPDDLAYLNNLEGFDASNCQFKKFPRFSTSVKDIWIDNNPDIDIPDDLTYLNNLEGFSASSCQSKKLPCFSTSVKDIWIRDNPGITKKEKQRFKKEHPNAKIRF